MQSSRRANAGSERYLIRAGLEPCRMRHVDRSAERYLQGRRRQHGLSDKEVIEMRLPYARRLR